MQQNFWQKQACYIRKTAAATCPRFMFLFHVPASCDRFMVPASCPSVYCKITRHGRGDVPTWCLSFVDPLRIPHSFPRFMSFHHVPASWPCFTSSHRVPLCVVRLRNMAVAISTPHVPAWGPRFMFPLYVPASGPLVCARWRALTVDDVRVLLKEYVPHWLYQSKGNHRIYIR